MRPDPVRGGGFSLTQEAVSGPLPAYGASYSQRVDGGSRVQVRAISLSGVIGGEGEGRLNLRLTGLGPRESAASVIALENIVARDDRGGILRMEGRRRVDSPQVRVSYPNEWSGEVQLEEPQPAATRLAWLEGDVIGVPVKPLGQCEVPLPLPVGGARKRVAGTVVEFETFTPAPRSLVPERRRIEGPTVVLRFHDLAVDQLRHNNGFPGTIGPVLVGASGRTYSPPSATAQGIDPGGKDWTLSCTYAMIDEPLMGIRLEFGDPQEERKLYSFRIENVPLPDVTWGAGTITSGAFFEKPMSPDRRDAGRPGGVLVSPVQVGGKPAPEGWQQVGLAPTDGSAGTEWYRVGNTGGNARLEGVRAGSYRVLRLYAARDSKSIPTGWWSNGEQVARVEDGKTVELPPLQLETRGEPKLNPGWKAAELRPGPLAAQADGVRLSYSRGVELCAPPRAECRGILQVRLSGSARTAPDRSLSQLANVVAEDDRGNLMSGVSMWKMQVGLDGKNPTWHQEVWFSAPHPHSTRLRWLEGDVMANATPYPAVASFPAPVVARATREVRDLSIEVDDLTSSLLPGEPIRTEYLLRGRAKGPYGTGLQGRLPAEAGAELVGASGRTYLPEQNYDSHGSGLWEVRDRFVVAEPITEVRFSLTVTPAPEALGSFRLINVALAKQRFFLPERPRGKVASRPLPYYPGAVRVEGLFAEGGARLVLPVRIQDQPVGSGALSIGLATRVGTGFGPIRWTEAEVVDGAARLEGLKPGEYRVLRVYRVKTEPRVSGPGKWVGEEIRVTLTSGKETSTPALRWTPIAAQPKR